MSGTYIFDLKETALIGSVLFSNLDADVQIVSGTGLIQPFVRIENTGTEEGFNYDLAVDPAKQQDYPMDVKDRQQIVDLNNVNIIEKDGVFYYEFRLDVNEPNSTTQKWISLDALKIYASNQADLYGLTSGSSDTWYDKSAGGTTTLDPIFSLDDGADRTIFLDGTLQAGSGKSDLAVYVPVDLFGGQQYAYFYSALGSSDSTSPAINGDSNSGFEEWAYVKKVFEANPGIAIDKVTVDGSATGDGITVLAGETVTWNYTVTNIGNVALSNVTVADDQAGVTPTYLSGDTNLDGKLDLTETWIFQASGTAVIGDYANIGTATGTFGTTTVDDSDPSSYFGANPQIAINKVTFDDGTSGDGLTILTGESIGWRYSVTNAGNVALSDVTVTDDQAGVTPGYVSGDDGDGLLEIGETWIYEANGTAIAGAYSNTGTASGSYTDTAGHTGTDTATDTSSYFGANPQIAIDKVTFDGATSGDGLTILTGESIGWRYSVTNAGNVALSNVTVTDDQAGVSPEYVSGDDGDGLLEIGETWIYQATGTAIAGAYSNTGTASGSYTDTAGHTGTDTATDTSSYFGANPQIAIDKVTNGSDGQNILVGTALTWTYTVTNVGNVALSYVTVTDDQGVIPIYVSGDTNSDSKLDLGETWIYEATGTAVAGPYSNIGTASGSFTDDAGHSRSDSATDPSSYFGADPSIAVDKVTNGGDCLALEVGTAITWTYTVTNTGNVALANISVLDDNGTPGNTADDFSAGYVSGDTNGDALLDVSETWIFKAYGTAEAGEYHNTAVASGDYEDDLSTDITVTAEDDSCYVGLQFEGLTPGFWGQEHNWSKVTLSVDCKEEFGVSSWSDFFYDLTLHDVFGVDDFSFGKGKKIVVFDADMTLYQAVNFNPAGGGAEAAMVRHAVAALANACAEEVTYFYDDQEIIDMVQDAWGSKSAMTEVRDGLQEQNELGLLEDQLQAMTTAWQANPDMVFA